MKILFIGNSFTGRNNLPDMLNQIAALSSSPVAIETEQNLVNGASLRLHWNAGKALDAIQSQPWDYIVLQEQSTLPIKNAGRFHENVRLFDTEIKKVGSRTALYLTWARRDVPETQKALTEGTTSIARELDALLIPVGHAWQMALNLKAELPLFDKDGSHPTATGSYLAACVFYATLCGGNTEKLPLPPTVKVEADNLGVVHKAVHQTICSFR
jgi:hypothetical protein